MNPQLILHAMLVSEHFFSSIVISSGPSMGEESTKPSHLYVYTVYRKHRTQFSAPLVSLYRVVIPPALYLFEYTPRMRIRSHLRRFNLRSQSI